MGKELNRLKKRKLVLQKIDDLQDQGSTSLVIHYSCESFYEKKDGATPRITSIAVRNLESGQTNSFSIHQIAEENHIPFQDIADHCDAIEKKMLASFFDFVQSRQHYNWIHWNMRDVNYGFAAIEHRARVLGLSPIQITEDKKFDLARALVQIFGIQYIGHPRFENILDKNNITRLDFLTGEEEANAFNNKDFVKLHRSTLRKVDCLANLLERIFNESIKTNANWFEQHGFSFSAIGEWFKENKLIAAVVIIGGIFTFILRAHDIIALFSH